MDDSEDVGIELSISNSKVIDPFRASLDGLVVIAFFKSRAASYPLVVGIAETAAQYGIFLVDGKPMHVAVFGRTQSDAGKASAIIWHTLTWKGVLVFCKGKLVPNGYSILEVVNCFHESCLCRDRRAHCHTVIDDPFIEKLINSNMPTSISINISHSPKQGMKREVRVDRYIFPCKYLYSRFSFQSDHPSSPEDQIQAGAVRAGCDICPNLEPGEFRKVGFKIIEKDFFE
jgi:hypothetical protein